MPRLNQTDTATVEQFGFEFSEPPEREATRRSRYDDLWSAAKELCNKFPGQSLKVRNYNNASTAYNDAKAINNAEHRMFSEDPAGAWTAVAVKNDEVLNAKDEATYDLFLKREKQ